MLARLNTAKKLYASFGALLFLLLGLAFISGRTFRSMAKADERNEHSHQVIATVQELLTSLVDMETGARGYMLAGRKEYLEPFERGGVNFDHHHSQAVSLTSDNPKYQQQLMRLHEQQRLWLDSYLPLIENREQVGLGTSASFIPGAARRKKEIERMRSIISGIKSYESVLLAQRSAEKTELRRKTRTTLLCGGGFAILLAVLLSTMLARSTHDLVEANKQLKQEMDERAVAQRKLQESELYFRSVTENALDIIAVLNLDGTVRYISPSITRILGYEPSELQDTLIFDYVHADDVERMREVKRQTIEGVADRGYSQYLFRHKDGSWRTLEFIGKYIEDSAVAGLVVNGRDVTERKAIERMKNEFVSTVSHELRTPLTSIVGSLGLIAGGVVGEIPQRAQALVAIAHKNSERLIRLVNDMLDIEKIESGKMAFKFEALELVPLVERSLLDNQPFADEFGVRLELQSHLVPTSMKIDGDSDRLLQVFTNLLSNAVKFSPHGGTVTVAITCPDDQSDRVRIAVTDQGPGIPEEFRSRLFEKFAQADSTGARKKGGTGLGLSITRAIVEMHQGTIEYSSAAENGTTFIVELPVCHDV